MNIITRGITFAAITIFICACSKPAEPVPLPPAPATPVPLPTPAATPLPSPVAIATPAPVVKHLAPEGVYFLLQRVSLTTDTGIVGINAGARVRLVKKTGDSWRMKEGQVEFDTTSDQLTNDLDIASAVIAQERNLAGAISENIRIQKEISHKTQQEMYARQEEQMKNVEANKTIPAPTYTSPLERGAYDQRRTYPYYYYPYYYPYSTNPYYYYNR